MRRWLLGTVFVVMSAGPVSAQPGPVGLTPTAFDLKRVSVGTWAEYSTTAGAATVKTRWAFVAREKQNNILETVVDAGPAAPAGSRMVMRMVVASDPLTPGGPIQKMIVQVGAQDPIEMPLDATSAGQQFQRPDPKKIVGKERLTVAAGSFNTTHYRDSSPDGTADVWISEDVPPIGMVKVKTVPSPGAKDGAGRPMPAVSVELVARGRDAKAMITKPAKPFNAAAFGKGPGMSTGAGSKDPPLSSQPTR